jgi:hypothetical protein
MTTIDLTRQEQTIFEEILHDVLSELRVEIAGTERQALRDRLRERKRVIQKALRAVAQQTGAVMTVGCSTDPAPMAVGLAEAGPKLAPKDPQADPEC